MTDEQMKQLEVRATILARNTGSMSDLNSAASTLKQLAEARKAAGDNTNQPRILLYELFKAIGTVLVPALSILTLYMTVKIQSDQLELSRKQLALTSAANEDTDWREAVKNALGQLSVTNAKTGNQELALAVLDPYVRRGSKHYDDAARLSLRLLSNIGSPYPFQDFLRTHRLGDKWDDMRILISTSRHLYSKSLSESPTEQGPIHEAVLVEIQSISPHISSLLQEHKADAKHIDLGGIYLWDTNLRDLDLSDADLTEALLQSVDLTGVLIGPRTTIDNGSYLLDSNWWDAAYISGDNLGVLIKQAYPYHKTDTKTVYQKEPPEAAVYRKRVSDLCAKTELLCPEIPYGTSR